MMKLFRKRSFALILCIVLVLCSTCISASVRLTKAADRVIDGFYSGFGRQAAGAEYISRLCAAGEDMAVLADSCGIDSAALRALSGELSSLIDDGSRDTAAVAQSCQAYLSELERIGQELSSAKLSLQQAEQMDECARCIGDALSGIESCGYNGRVDDLAESFSRFPASVFVSLFGIDLPAKIA